MKIFVFSQKNKIFYLDIFFQMGKKPAFMRRCSKYPSQEEPGMDRNRVSALHNFQRRSQ